MKLTTKTLGVVLAASAVVGLGATAASAAPTHLRDAAVFRVDLLNNTTSPLEIYTYIGSDWDTVDPVSTPPIGTVIAPKQDIGVFLYFHGGASDAVGLRPTAYAGNLGLGITQDNFGDSTESVLGDSTLDMNIRPSGDGYNILNITNPQVYTEKTVLAFQTNLRWLSSTGIPAFTCPAEDPWLVNQDLSPGRIVPTGVEVEEAGSVGVTIGGANDDTSGLANGWQANGASATNWDVHDHVVQVYAHCTNNPALSYTGS